MPLTPEERRWLVIRPFPMIRRLTTSYPNAGTLIDRSSDDLVAIRKRLEKGEAINPATLDELSVLYGGE